MKRFLRTYASLVLLAFLAGQSAVFAASRHGAFDDDAACRQGEVIAGPHHQAGPQVEETLPASPIDHCAFCHLQRAVSHARLVGASQAMAPAAAVRGSREPATTLAFAFDRRSPTRGPPARS